MKICFVQPDTDYQIKQNRHALALTFPQLISDLEIEQTDYCVYVAGKSTCSFDIFLVSQGVTHVFITAITSTFPYAIEFARIAQEKKCITVLGGLFASINYNVVINKNQVLFLNLNAVFAKPLIQFRIDWSVIVHLNHRAVAPLENLNNDVVW